MILASYDIGELLHTSIDIIGSRSTEWASCKAFVVAIDAAAVIIGMEVVNFFSNSWSRTSVWMTGKFNKLPEKFVIKTSQIKILLN